VDQESYATFVIELLLDEHGDVRRTRVVHVQTALEHTWPGWDGQRLLGLILRFTGPAAG
jgi:hypothetical protein